MNIDQELIEQEIIQKQLTRLYQIIEHLEKCSSDYFPGLCGEFYGFEHAYNYFIKEEDLKIHSELKKDLWNAAKNEARLKVNSMKFGGDRELKLKTYERLCIKYYKSEILLYIAFEKYKQTKEKLKI